MIAGHAYTGRVPRFTTLLACLSCLLMPMPAQAEWSAAQTLIQRAESEFPERLRVVRSLADASRLPEDAQRQLRAAHDSLFSRVRFKGVITPFRLGLFDSVRCAIYVPDDMQDADAELWSLAHEIGHCVARLNGWQSSLWTDPDLETRHRSESWADAFAALAVPHAERMRLATMAQRERARLGDAAYMTEKAIGCGAAAPVSEHASLTQLGAQVEDLLHGTCLVDRAHLQATADFLATIR